MSESRVGDARELRPALAQYEFRADRFSYVVLAGPPFVFSMIFTCFMAFGNESTRGVWAIALLAWAVLLAVLLLLRSFRIIIRDGILAYRFSFRGTRSIRLGEIKRAIVNVKLLTTPVGRPPYALVIEPLPESGVKPFAINMKLLSRDDLRTLFHILGDKVLDEKHRMDAVVGKRRRRPN